MRWVCAIALLLVVPACGQGDSGNVMTSGANALPPALVDLALGPEGEAAPANAVAAENAPTSAEPVRVDQPTPPPRTSNRTDTAPAEPADATAEEEAATDNGLEE